MIWDFLSTALKQLVFFGLSVALSPHLYRCTQNSRHTLLLAVCDARSHQVWLESLARGAIETLFMTSAGALGVNPRPDVNFVADEINLNVLSQVALARDQCWRDPAPWRQTIESRVHVIRHLSRTQSEIAMIGSTSMFPLSSRQCDGLWSRAVARCNERHA
jgi:hypothetical protein